MAEVGFSYFKVRRVSADSAFEQLWWYLEYLSTDFADFRRKQMNQESRNSGKSLNRSLANRR